MKTLNQIKKEALSRIENIKSFTSLGNGWFSTSEETPELGSLFKALDEPILVSFIDKYKRKHDGYLYEFSYIQGLKGRIMSGTVLVSDGKNGFINYGVDLKKLKSTTKFSIPNFDISEEFQPIFAAYDAHKKKISDLVDKMMVYPSPSNYSELQQELYKLHAQTNTREYIK